MRAFGWFCGAILLACGGASDAATDAGRLSVEGGTSTGMQAAGDADADAVGRVDAATSPSDGSARPDAEAASPDAAGATQDATDGGATGLSCDPRSILCKRAETPCPAGQVHRIVNGCYGDCVPITDCECDGPAACPHDESYTCWNNTGHCNYYGP